MELYGIHLTVIHCVDFDSCGFANGAQVRGQMLLKEQYVSTVNKEVRENGPVETHPPRSEYLLRR